MTHVSYGHMFYTVDILDTDRKNELQTHPITNAEVIPLNVLLERAAAGIDRHVNAHKTEYKYFDQTRDISTLKISETSWQVHLPREQCLVNRDRHLQATNKGMGSYQ